MSQLQTKHIDLAIKSVEDETGIIVGYGSFFGNVDAYGDIVQPGAFKKTITERLPKVLWQHDPSCPIGVCVEAKEDRHGLRVKARLAKTGKGAEAYELIRMGAVDGLSIGYKTVQEKFDKRGLRLIEEVKLYEVSAVTFPANEKAIIEQIKALHMDVQEAEAERIAEIVNNLIALHKGLVAGGTADEEPLVQNANPAQDTALNLGEAAGGDAPQTSSEPQLHELLHSLGTLKAQIESALNGTNDS